MDVIVDSCATTTVVLEILWWSRPKTMSKLELPECIFRGEILNEQCICSSPHLLKNRQQVGWLSTRVCAEQCPPRYRERGPLIESALASVQAPHYGRPKPINKEAATSPCVHLGKPTGRIELCVICGDRGTMRELHECAIHSACTPVIVENGSAVGKLVYRENGKTVNVEWCWTCADYRKTE